jgi:hypothetical protein
VEERTPLDAIILSDYARTHDIIDVAEDGSYIVATERGPERRQLADPSVVDMRELGTAVASPLGSWMRQEYNRALIGKQGLRMYDQMRRSDGTVRSTLRLFKTPILSARWFMVPASDSTRDKNVADFIWKNLTLWMSSSWPQFLTESLLMLDFGYYAFEKVFDMAENVPAAAADPSARGKVVWQKLAPRHPMDIQEWLYDANGGPDGIRTLSGTTGPSNSSAPIFIPIDKLLVFTFDKEGGDMGGISALRSAYMHWYYKNNLYKIDAIQKERHGIGVPIIQLPPNFNDADKQLADQIGRNLRTNERAHVVLPPNWEIIFAKLEGQPVSALDSVKHHDLQIQKNILAQFMNDDAAQNMPEAFLKSTRYVADIVTDVINKYAIPQLVDYNWSRVGYPQLKARRIGENVDWRTFSMAVRNFTGAGVIKPDDPLEDMVRDEMDLPKRDPATTREVLNPELEIREDVSGEGVQGDLDNPHFTGTPSAGTPQPAKTGQPRQATVAGQQGGVFGQGSKARGGSSGRTA